jgi:adenosylcobinamide-GDP ribazoletransferase
MKKEIRIFFTALMFYTRIPCPKWVDHDEEYLNKATRYFPLIGWIVGGIGALVFFGASFIFSKEISLLLAMVSGILVTGAFHEDGFADVCDGFGGGWTKERILDIMKDSRVGAYGVIGIIFMLVVKFYALMSIDATFIPLVLLSSHAFSRWCAASFIYTHDYVRENDTSKIKPIAKKLSAVNLSIGAIFGTLPLLGFWNPILFLLIIPAYITKILLGRYFTKWIGGYTGDCLGATQQVCELVFYLSAIALWKFI